MSRSSQRNCGPQPRKPVSETGLLLIQSAVRGREFGHSLALRIVGSAKDGFMRKPYTKAHLGWGATRGRRATVVTINQGG